MNINVYDCIFSQIKEREGIQVWKGDTKHKTILANENGYSQCRRILEQRYGRIEIQSLQRKGDQIDFITPDIIHHINYQTCKEYQQKVNENRKKQDRQMGDYTTKPSNVVMEGD